MKRPVVLCLVGSFLLSFSSMPLQASDPIFVKGEAAHSLMDAVTNSGVKAITRGFFSGATTAARRIQCITTAQGSACQIDPLHTAQRIVVNGPVASHLQAQLQAHVPDSQTTQSTITIEDLSCARPTSPNLVASCHFTVVP